MAAVYPEAVAVCRQMGTKLSSTSIVSDTKHRAADMAWLVAALRMRTLYDCLFDAGTDATVGGSTYYRTDSILLEPNDYGRLLWLAKRIDVLKIDPPIEVLQQYDPQLFAFCDPRGSEPPSSRVEATVSGTSRAGRKLLAHAGGGFSEDTDDDSIDVLVACRRRMAVAATLKGRLLLATRQEALQDQGRITAALRVNYLLRDRVSSESLKVRGILQCGSLPNLELVRGCEIIVERQSHYNSKRYSRRKGVKSPIHTSSEETLGEAYYRVWLLQPSTANGGKRIVPVSRDSRLPPYARKRYRDFLSLHTTLVASASSSVPIPALPPWQTSTSWETLEKQRVSLEGFLTALVANPLWRHSHELFVFLRSGSTEVGPRNRLLDGVEYEDSNSSHTSDSDDEVVPGCTNDICGITPTRAPPWSPSASNEPQSVILDRQGFQTVKILSAPLSVAAGSVAPHIVKANKNVVTTPHARQLKTSDWHKLRRVEYRCYVLLRTIFEIDRLGMLRRNFVALIRRVTITFWSPSFATWLGDQTKRKYITDSLAGFVRQVNGSLLQSIPSREDTRTDHQKYQDTADAVAVLRRDIVTAVPASLASLLGQRATKDAVDKLIELVLCPGQLRSIMLTLLDLAIVEVFPELELDIAGREHLA